MLITKLIGLIAVAIGGVMLLRNIVSYFLVVLTMALGFGLLSFGMWLLVG